MEINRFGGAISSFELLSQKVNPYTWISRKWELDDLSEKQGLFIFFDRMGFPSDKEQEKGIPFHGEKVATPMHITNKIHLDIKLTGKGFLDLFHLPLQLF